MAVREIRPWTLCGLIGAFINLALAYFLLCTSTFLFLPSKFLRFVGLHLPCPCFGIFGFRNGYLCWHRLLIDWPVGSIRSVQMLVKSRFPFDLVWFRDEDREIRVVELGGEGSSSSVSSQRNQNLIDSRDSGCKAKGKRVAALKQRLGIRQRRRPNPYGKLASVFPDGSLLSVAPPPIVSSFFERRQTKDKNAESLVPLSGKEDGSPDDLNTSIGNYEGVGACQSFEMSGSFGESNDTDKNSVCSEKCIDYNEEKKFVAGSEFDMIRKLEQALEEERATSAGLYLELEKERAAAATAADEAMAMISRIQKDKASMEIEARQYHRMMEEKFAYDEEEIEILKDILVRREKENHFLEREVETYRHMSVTGDEQSCGDISDLVDEWGQKPSSSFYSSVDSESMHKTVNAKSHYDNMESDADFQTRYEVPFVDKQSHSNGHDFIKERVLFIDRFGGNHPVDEN
ncbi:hypothetical protein TIFTF001_019482 [Ficus carica]|uniref:GTD-binding domain-containing protein n=1 Tax=Ficus carica TaxID=3494 RepID=A0AA88AQI4_FICCA|nr:hypothetical protein TIFTF001_019482 [Ficus carica]